MKKLPFFLILAFCVNLANAALMPPAHGTQGAAVSMQAMDHESCPTDDAAVSGQTGTLHATTGHGCCPAAVLTRVSTTLDLTISDTVYVSDLAQERVLEVFDSIFKPPKRYF